jgi:hypothetical protein
MDNRARWVRRTSKGVPLRISLPSTRRAINHLSADLPIHAIQAVGTSAVGPRGGRHHEPAQVHHAPPAEFCGAGPRTSLRGHPLGNTGEKFRAGSGKPKIRSLRVLFPISYLLSVVDAVDPNHSLDRTNAPGRLLRPFHSVRDDDEAGCRPAAQFHRVGSSG